MKGKLLFLAGVFCSSFCGAQNITANFSKIGKCDTYCFMDLSTSNNGPILSWNWNFPGGTPATATTQNPPCIVYPPGIYTLTLAVTNSSGDVNSMTDAIYVGGFPEADFASSNSCFGNSSSMYDASIWVPTDPIEIWEWTMPGGSPSVFTTTTNAVPYTLYSAAGTHTVSLVVISQEGCKDSISHLVNVMQPIVTFNTDAIGDTVFFTDMSTVLGGGHASYWHWYCPGGFPGSSTEQNPVVVYPGAGTYTVCLSIMTNSACQETYCDSINVLAVPDNQQSASIDILPSISSTGIFSVSIFNSPARVQRLRVYDVSGRKVDEVRNLSKYSSSIPIDLSQHRSGVYFVCINTDAGSVTKKIIITK
jgi:PKD repeat protein